MKCHVYMWSAMYIRELLYYDKGSVWWLPAEGDSEFRGEKKLYPEECGKFWKNGKGISRRQGNPSPKLEVKMNKMYLKENE